MSIFLFPGENSRRYIQRSVRTVPEAIRIRHRYHLRSDFLFSLVLPSDLTLLEAERLARSILTYPFQQDHAE